MPHMRRDRYYFGHGLREIGRRDVHPVTRACIQVSTDEGTAKRANPGTPVHLPNKANIGRTRILQYRDKVEIALTATEAANRSGPNQVEPD